MVKKQPEPKTGDGAGGEAKSPAIERRSIDSREVALEEYRKLLDAEEGDLARARTSLERLWKKVQRVAIKLEKGTNDEEVARGRLDSFGGAYNAFLDAVEREVSQSAGTRGKGSKKVGSGSWGEAVAGLAAVNNAGISSADEKKTPDEAGRPREAAGKRELGLDTDDVDKILRAAGLPETGRMVGEDGFEIDRVAFQKEDAVKYTGKSGDQKEYIIHGFTEQKFGSNKGKMKILFRDAVGKVVAGPYVDNLQGDDPQKSYYIKLVDSSPAPELPPSDESLVGKGSKLSEKKGGAGPPRAEAVVAPEEREISIHDILSYDDSKSSFIIGDKEVSMVLAGGGEPVFTPPRKKEGEIYFAQFGYEKNGKRAAIQVEINTALKEFRIKTFEYVRVKEGDKEKRVLRSTASGGGKDFSVKQLQNELADRLEDVKGDIDAVEVRNRKVEKRTDRTPRRETSKDDTEKNRLLEEAGFRFLVDGEAVKIGDKVEFLKDLNNPLVNYTTWTIVDVEVMAGDVFMVIKEDTIGTRQGILPEAFRSNVRPVSTGDKKAAREPVADESVLTPEQQDNLARLRALKEKMKIGDREPEVFTVTPLRGGEVKVECRYDAYNKCEVRYKEGGNLLFYKMVEGEEDRTRGDMVVSSNEEARGHVAVFLDVFKNNVAAEMTEGQAALGADRAAGSSERPELPFGAQDRALRDLDRRHRNEAGSNILPEQGDEAATGLGVRVDSDRSLEDAAEMARQEAAYNQAVEWLGRVDPRTSVQQLARDLFARGHFRDGLGNVKDGRAKAFAHAVIAWMERRPDGAASTTGGRRASVETEPAATYEDFEIQGRKPQKDDMYRYRSSGGEQFVLRVVGVKEDDEEDRIIFEMLAREKETWSRTKEELAQVQDGFEFVKNVPPGSDEMFDRALNVVLLTGDATPSNLRDKLALDDFRVAGRLLHELERVGVVGPVKDDRTRDVLIGVATAEESGGDTVHAPDEADGEHEQTPDETDGVGPLTQEYKIRGRTIQVGDKYIYKKIRRAREPGERDQEEEIEVVVAGEKSVAEGRGKNVVFNRLDGVEFKTFSQHYLDRLQDRFTFRPEGAPPGGEGPAPDADRVVPPPDTVVPPPREPRRTRETGEVTGDFALPSGKRLKKGMELIYKEEVAAGKFAYTRVHVEKQIDDSGVKKIDLLYDDGRNFNTFSEADWVGYKSDFLEATPEDKERLLPYEFTLGGMPLKVDDFVYVKDPFEVDQGVQPFLVQEIYSEKKGEEKIVLLSEGTLGKKEYTKEEWKALRSEGRAGRTPEAVGAAEIDEVDRLRALHEPRRDTDKIHRIGGTLQEFDENTMLLRIGEHGESANMLLENWGNPKFESNLRVDGQVELRWTYENDDHELYINLHWNENEKKFSLVATVKAKEGGEIYELYALRNETIDMSGDDAQLQLELRLKSALEELVSDLENEFGDLLREAQEATPEPEEPETPPDENILRFADFEISKQQKYTYNSPDGEVVITFDSIEGEGDNQKIKAINEDAVIYLFIADEFREAVRSNSLRKVTEGPEEPETAPPTQEQLDQFMAELEAERAMLVHSCVDMEAFDRKYTSGFLTKKKEQKAREMRQQWHEVWRNYEAKQREVVRATEERAMHFSVLLRAESKRLDQEISKALGTAQKKGMLAKIGEIWQKMGDMNLTDRYDRMLREIQTKIENGEELTEKEKRHQTYWTSAGRFRRFVGKALSMRTAVGSVLAGGAMVASVAAPVAAGGFMVARGAFGGAGMTMGSRSAMDRTGRWLLGRKTEMYQDMDDAKAKIAHDLGLVEEDGELKLVTQQMAELRAKKEKKGWSEEKYQAEVEKITGKLKKKYEKKTTGKKGEKLKAKTLEKLGDTDGKRLQIVNRELARLEGYEHVNTGVDITQDRKYIDLVQMREQLLDNIQADRTNVDAQDAGEYASYLNELTQRKQRDVMGDMRKARSGRNWKRVGSVALGTAFGVLVGTRALAHGVRAARDWIGDKADWAAGKLGIVQESTEGTHTRTLSPEKLQELRAAETQARLDGTKLIDQQSAAIAAAEKARLTGLTAPAEPHITVPTEVVVGPQDGSAWGVIGRQLEAMYGEKFSSLPRPQRSYVIDLLSDQYKSNPERYVSGGVVNKGDAFDFQQLVEDVGGQDRVQAQLDRVLPGSDSFDEQKVATLTRTGAYRDAMRAQYGSNWKQVLAEQNMPADVDNISDTSQEVVDDFRQGRAPQFEDRAPGGEVLDIQPTNVDGIVNVILENAAGQSIVEKALVLPNGKLSIIEAVLEGGRTQTTGPVRVTGSVISEGHGGGGGFVEKPKAEISAAQKPVELGPGSYTKQDYDQYLRQFRAWAEIQGLSDLRASAQAVGMGELDLSEAIDKYAASMAEQNKGLSVEKLLFAAKDLEGFEDYIDDRISERASRYDTGLVRKGPAIETAPAEDVGRGRPATRVPRAEAVPTDKPPAEPTRVPRDVPPEPAAEEPDTDEDTTGSDTDRRVGVGKKEMTFTIGGEERTIIFQDRHSPRMVDGQLRMKVPLDPTHPDVLTEVAGVVRLKDRVLVFQSTDLAQAESGHLFAIIQDGSVVPMGK